MITPISSISDDLFNVFVLLFKSVSMACWEVEAGKYSRTRIPDIQVVWISRYRKGNVAMGWPICTVTRSQFGYREVPGESDSGLEFESAAFWTRRIPCRDKNHPPTDPRMSWDNIVLCSFQLRCDDSSEECGLKVVKELCLGHRHKSLQKQCRCRDQDSNLGYCGHNAGY